MLSRLRAFAATISGHFGTILGHSVRLAGRYGVGLAAVGLVSVGVGGFDVRAGLIVAGLALFFLDGKVR